MNILYFGNFMDLAETRLGSVEAKIWFKNNAWILPDGSKPKEEFEWDYTTTINEIYKVPYNGLVLDLSALSHGARTFERQYISRTVLRQIDDRRNTFFVCLNEYTFECLKKEAIRDLTKYSHVIPVSKKGVEVKALIDYLHPKRKF